MHTYIRIYNSTYQHCNYIGWVIRYLSYLGHLLSGSRGFGPNLHISDLDSNIICIEKCELRGQLWFVL